MLGAGCALLLAPATFAAEVSGESALVALANARLAEEAGEPLFALQALAIVASHAPELPGLSGRVLDQAVKAGDLPAARSAALKLWQAGDRRLDARMTLLADAVRRSDWKGARFYIEDGGDKTGRDPVSRLIAPAISGWIAVAMRDREPEAVLLTTGGRAASDAVYTLDAALMLLLTRRAPAALTQIESLPLSDRSSQLLAMRIAATLQKQGLSAEAAALRQRVANAAVQRDDPVLLLPAQPVATATGGMAQWFAMLSDGLARTPNANAKVPLLFARVSQWIEPADWQGRLALVESLVKNDQTYQAIALLAGQKGAMPPVLALRHAELVADGGDIAAAMMLAQAAVASPDSPRGLLIRYADLARRSGDKDVAIAAFDRLAATLSDSEDDQALRGQLLVAKADLLIKDQQWLAARPLLEQAVTLLPDDASTLNFAGYSALERRENIPLAVQRIEAAWRLQPQNAGITDSLGWAYFVTGKTDQAVALLENAMLAEPDNAVIIEHLGDAYWISGQKFGARYHWRAAALLAESTMADRISIKLRDGLTPATIAP